MKGLRIVSIGEWVKIAGVVLSALVTFVGFVAWLSHVDSRVGAIESAQATEHQERAKRDDDVLVELRDVNTRLSRIEGAQAETLKAVKNGN